MSGGGGLLSSSVSGKFGGGGVVVWVFSVCWGLRVIFILVYFV